MSDQKYMARALELAVKGLGNVSPNPMVGCVIVKNDLILGEGYHMKYGGPHAEVNAVNAVKNQGQLAGAAVYVTLEPCSHFGKTPPCADLLIEKKVGRVVISQLDPNPLVAGKGAKKLKEAGIEVSMGVMEKEGEAINKRFFTSQLKRRPYVILKWAETADGFIARDDFTSKWISNPRARQLVHQWRAEEDAILVGTSTAMHDNPSLTVRDWTGPNPLRVVLDRNLKLDLKLSLFDGQVKTLVLNLKSEEMQNNVELVKLETMDPISILEALHARNIQSVIIEGGAQVLQSFVTSNLWDEARVFRSENKFGSGKLAPKLNGEKFRSEQILDNTLNTYLNYNG